MSGITYRTAWRAISARISGLERAAAIHAGFLQANSQSPYGVEKDLQVHCSGIWGDIQRFRQDFESTLPQTVIGAICRFADNGGTQIQDNSAGDAKLVRTILVKLIAFDAEVSYLLNDFMEQVRSASELAFMHLQRLIVVDADYRQKWQQAFGDHETKCEQLGGLHLLWHGILAFKVDAAGGKTDLVYQEHLTSGGQSGVQGLVLTEWKRAKENPQKSFDEAREQTKIYSSGIVGGVELSSHRYLVAVTDKQITPPADIVAQGVTYRHINIAVSPDTPSQAAKKLAK